jgi:hypothetical protein
MGSTEITGNGALYERGKRLGDVRYIVTSTRLELQGAPTHMSGRIFDGKVDLTAILLRNPKVLTLHLENGLRWDCRLGDNGRLIPVGGALYRIVEGLRVDEAS